MTLCVSDSVTITPDRLHFGRATRGQAVSGKTGTGSSEAQRRRACTRFSAVSRTLTITTGPDTRLKSAAARPEVLKIDLGVSDDQGAIPARLTLKPDVPYGPLAGEVRLEFIGQENYMLTVPFTAYVAEETDAE